MLLSRPAPLLPLGLLLLLSGCCETQGEVTCTLNGAAAADARLVGELSEECGYGHHYPDDKTTPRLVLALATHDKALRLRTEVRDTAGLDALAFTLPPPGEANAQVASFDLQLPEGFPALLSAEGRLEAYDLRKAHSQRGVIALRFEGGLQCEVAFTLCEDPDLNIGEPPESSGGGGGDIDWDD